MLSGIQLFSLSLVVGTSSPNSRIGDVILQLARGEFPMVTISAVLWPSWCIQGGKAFCGPLYQKRAFCLSLVAVGNTRVSGLWVSLRLYVVAGGLVSTGAFSKRTLLILMALVSLVRLFFFFLI